MYERLRELTKWWGIGRIVTTTGMILGVALGVWWVLRVPPPPIETTIAYATTSVAQPNGAVDSPLTVGLLKIRVHVAGEVKAPGVYQLVSTDRVIDAISAAGGPSAFADLDVINLAAPLFDSAQIFVPRRSFAAPRPTLPYPSPGVNAPPTAANASPVGGTSPRININTASLNDLDTLTGVGPSTAKAIIDYRLKNGPFAVVDDLLNVRGIGPAKLEAIREQVSL